MKHEAIFFILNKGHVDEAMAAARDAGATGGTVITARGAASPEEALKIFGIAVQHEKEILLILSPADKRSEIMSAISKAAGLNKPGCGIGFSLPAEDVTGITPLAGKDRR
ncbi:MAG: P-II family nitrogen regulator [Clostridia bacterium]|nr:P-II family nitrogen regulator [Clostridia bacterium]